MAIKSEHAFSTDALKDVIARYGSRIKYIKTTYATIAVNQRLNNMPYINTDELVTFEAGGYDMLEVRAFDSMSRCEYTSVIRIEDIVDFVVVDNERDHINPYYL
jgi:hypothetical protein